MKPEPPPAPAKLEEFLDPAQFPDELAWVPSHYRMHPADPVYLLIAWHWRRVKKSEDTLAAGILELRTLLDARTANLAQAAETISGVNDALAGVQAILEEKPTELSAQVDRMLAQPIENALHKVQGLEKSLGSVAQNFELSRRRQILAAFVCGIALGVCPWAPAVREGRRDRAGVYEITPPGLRRRHVVLGQVEQASESCAALPAFAGLRGNGGEVKPETSFLATLCQPKRACY